MSEEFSKTGNKAIFEIKALSQDFSNQLLQAYYREAFSEGSCASQVLSPFIRICEFVRRAINSLSKALRRLIRNTLRRIIFLISAKQLEKFGFPTFNCQVEKNDVLTQEQEEAFHAENEQIVQAANEEALRAMEQLEQMAPLQRKRNQPLIFKRKKLQLNSS